jgi:hypothetical protein
MLQVPITAEALPFIDSVLNDVSTAKHGYVPKAPNDANKFLNGLGAWSAGFAYGSSISGTTADGLAITLSNSADASATALNLTAGNTQSNVNALAQFNIGTSGNTAGILVKGTGSATGGALGTGKVHMQLWGNTATNTNKVLTVASETSYTETLAITANGTIAITSQASPAASTVFHTITANNTNANNTALMSLQIGTSAKVQGLMIKGTGSSTTGDIGTGIVHASLWANVSSSTVKVLSIANGTSYTERAYIAADGSASFSNAGVTISAAGLVTLIGTSPGLTVNLQNATSGTMITLGSTTSGSNSSTGIACSSAYNGGGTASRVFNLNPTQAMTSANNTDQYLLQFSPSVTSANTITSTGVVVHMKRAASTSSNASANFTASGPVCLIDQTYTQTTGTLAVTGVLLQLTQASSCTGAPLSFTQNNVTTTNFRKLWTETNTGFTVWVSNGTDPNGSLSGTAGDICYNGATNKPEYCTGTTNWTALV